MAKLIGLRAPASMGGEFRAVDPDTFDVEAAKRDGFMVVPEGPTREVREQNYETPPGERGWLGATPNQMVRKAVPSAAALGLSLLVPESIPFRAAPLLRMGAAGVGGLMGELGAQGMSGEQMNPDAAVSRGVGEAGAQGLGEVGVGLLSHLGENIYRGVLKPGKALASTATETASRIAGEPVAPDVASLARQGLRERVPIGRGLTGTGGEKMAKLQAPSNDQLTDALEAAGISGHTTPIRALADGITALKDEVRHETRAASKIAKIDEMWREMLDKYRHPVKGGGIGKDVRLTPQQLQDEVRTWQNQASSFWKGRERGNPDELAAIGARFDAALASAGRRHLNSIPAPSHIPGKTLGNLIEEANTRLSSLHPLGDAISNAEVGMQAGTSGSPWYMHAGAPAVGAMAGGAAGGAHGAGAGALLGLLADRAVTSPASGSRIALGMTNPVTQETMRNLPRLLMMLTRPDARDVTNPGGTR